MTWLRSARKAIMDRAAIGTMEDYSQNGEQAKILVHTPAMGRFLDIGAYRPKELSNTRALYERGWSGVMFEPSPGPMRSLLREYGQDERITLVQAAVGPERGIYKLDVTDSAYSGRDTRERWKQEAEFVGSIWVPFITIEDVLNQFGAFQFVNIDAEGLSMSILSCLVASAMEPPCICCEHDGFIQRAANLGEQRGYKVATINGTNIVLTR